MTPPERERPAAKSERAAPDISIPAPPRLEIGTLAWVPKASLAAEDELVTAAFRLLATPGMVPADKARELGRGLGRAARAGARDEFLRAFSHLGIGRIDARESRGPRHEFVGIDLPVDALTSPPACSIALGFLEGLVHATSGHPTLGTEITCRGRGHAECRFLVMEKL